MEKPILAAMLSCSGTKLTDAEKTASRRVEFKFRLNDEDMVQQMIEILSEDTQD